MNTKERLFVGRVLLWYERNGRHGLPWRHTTNPYHILVSEVMLQQTQVNRVIPKYKAFLQRFPTVAVLARAPLADVLTLWQGLGYNRRAKCLHECAQVVVRDYEGVFPAYESALRTLPGIGAYTAGAMLAFAFNQGIPIIETNIRTVYLEHFFKNAAVVTDKEILHIVTKTLPPDNPREWYYALMDYGAHLKRVGKGQLHKSRAYRKQLPFKGSNRQLRGAIIRFLTQNHRATKRALRTKLSDFSESTLDIQLQKLVGDGLLQRINQYYCLAT
jgi:A/G-specific adenine glycosylase